MQKYSKRSWNKKNSVNKAFGSKFPPSYPNEMLVKTLSSSKYSFLTKKFINKKKKICEIGCFSGNNLRFFIERKEKVYGVEINKNLLNLCKNNLKRFNINFRNLYLGSNTNLPFKAKYFDFLVSINTIHYTRNNEINLAFKEIKRVLKPGGVLYLETVNIDDEFVESSKRISKFNWKHLGIGFRKNSNLSFFDGKKHLQSELQKHFKKVNIFTRVETTIKSKKSFLIALCKV